jgi:hypothetical protein
MDPATKLTRLNFKKIQKFKKWSLAKTFANRPAFIFELGHFLAIFEFKRKGPWVFPCPKGLRAFRRLCGPTRFYQPPNGYRTRRREGHRSSTIISTWY